MSPGALFNILYNNRLVLKCHGLLTELILHLLCKTNPTQLLIDIEKKDHGHNFSYIDASIIVGLA